MEHLPDAARGLTLQELKSIQDDELPVDNNEESSAMEVDEENGRPKKGYCSLLVSFP